MTKAQHIKHLLIVAVLVAASGAVELLTSGSWSRWHWAVPAAGLLTYVIRLLNGQAGKLTGFSLALVLASLLGLTSCAHVQHVVSCAGHDVSEADVTRVWNDVATGNDADLIAEAATVGWDVVSCVIADLEQQGKLTHEQAKHGQSVKP